MVASPAPERLDALTGLRFLAAIHVVLFHFGRASVEGWPIVDALAARGFVGVGVFFVLSGFILVHTTEGRPLDARRFWLHRFARVYPLYAVSLALALPFTWQGVTDSGAASDLPLALALAAALLQAWSPTLWGVINFPAWSLSVEAFFYLVFPWLRPRLAGARHPLAAALAPWALVLTGVLLAAGGVVTAETETPWASALKFLPPLRLPEFVLGMAAGLLFARGRRAPPAVTLGAAALVLALLLVGRLPYLALHDGLLAPLFALLIAGLASGAGPLTRLLASPALVRLGDASYGVYILHVPLWTLVAWLNARSIRLPEPTLFWPYLPVLVALSVLALRFVERPARRRLRALAGPDGKRLSDARNAE